MRDNTPKLVTGALAKATPEGFASLLDKCNVMLAQGRTLVGIVNIGHEAIGAIFGPAPKTHTNLTNEEESW